MNRTTDTSAVSLLARDDGFDPTEDRLRANIRSTIEAVFNEEPDSFLGRLRHGQRGRRITGTVGTETVSAARARIEDDAGKVHEWRPKALPRQHRLTTRADVGFDGRSSGRARG